MHFSRAAPPAFTLALAAIIVSLAVLASGPAAAKNHLWRFTEFFSNEDGTIQFIEMQETGGSDTEWNFSGSNIDSLLAGQLFLFGRDLEPPTAHKWILLATQGFADLPGAPTPDFILPDGFFLPSEDVIRYQFAFDWIQILPAWNMPTDGIHSIDRNGVVAINSPTNFAGVTGSVSVPPGVPGLRPTGPASWIVALAILLCVALGTRFACLITYSSRQIPLDPFDRTLG